MLDYNQSFSLSKAFVNIQKPKAQSRKKLVISTYDELEDIVRPSSNRVYALIHHFSTENELKGKGYQTHMSAEYISEHLRIALSTVYYAINELIEKRLIEERGREAIFRNPKDRNKKMTRLFVPLFHASEKDFADNQPPKVEKNLHEVENNFHFVENTQPETVEKPSVCELSYIEKKIYKDISKSDEDFKKILGVFPMRSDPVNVELAKKAFKNAIRKASFEEILEGVKNYAEERDEKIRLNGESDRRYTKTLNNWLDSEMWKGSKHSEVKESKPRTTSDIESVEEPEDCKQLRRLILSAVGEEIYCAWFKRASISKTDGKFVLLYETQFRCTYAEQHSALNAGFPEGVEFEVKQ